MDQPVDLKRALEFQDLYVTILWKYLVYQYGYTEAILRYAALIKTILDMQMVMETMIRSRSYCEMIEKILVDAEDLLTVDG